VTPLSEEIWLVVERKKLNFGFLLVITWLALIFAVIKYGYLRGIVVPLMIIFFPYQTSGLVTNTQKFGWGSMYGVPTNSPPYEEGGPRTYLLLNFDFSKISLSEKCTLTVKRVLLRNPDTDQILMEATEPRVNYMIRSSSQFGYPNHRFDYVQSDLPLHLRVDMEYICFDVRESHTFSQKLRHQIWTPAYVIYEGMLGF